MSAALRILAAGPGVTIQDGGRRGFLRYGVTGAGPMDRFAFVLANRAAGQPDDAAAIEVSLGGLALAAEGEAVSIAVAGGEFKIALDGRPLPAAARFRIDPGARLSIKAGSVGAWCYLAPSAAIDVEPVLGSRATHTRSWLGGLDGRALRAGDVVPLSAVRVVEERLSAIVAPAPAGPAGVIRVVLGPQDDFFPPDQIAAFLDAHWRVSPRSDRMAFLLEGPRLRHAGDFNIVSDGIALGAIQVPGDGKPLVLMADRQPTGGYPKIANVIGPDIGRLAQLRPGETVRFAAVSIADAVAARRLEQAALDRLELQPLVRRDLTSEALLSLNLVGGMTAGRDLD